MAELTFNETTTTIAHCGYDDGMRWEWPRVEQTVTTLNCICCVHLYCTVPRYLPCLCCVYSALGRWWMCGVQICLTSLESLVHYIWCGTKPLSLGRMYLVPSCRQHVATPSMSWLMTPFPHYDIMKFRRRVGPICRTRRRRVVSSVVLGPTEDVSWDDIAS